MNLDSQLNDLLRSLKEALLMRDRAVRPLMVEVRLTRARITRRDAELERRRKQQEYT